MASACGVDGAPAAWARPPHASVVTCASLIVTAVSPFRMGTLPPFYRVFTVTVLTAL